MNLLERLGLSTPIFLAPMAGVSTPELAAIVSNSGGLGALGLGASNPLDAKEAIERTKQLTSKPFQVNFFCHQPQDYNPDEAQAWINYLRPRFEELGVSPPVKMNKIYQSFVENDEMLQVVLETLPAAVSFHFGLPTPHQLAALKEAKILTMVSVTQLSEALEAQKAGIEVIVAQGLEAGGHRGTFNPQCDPSISTRDLVVLLKKHIDLPIVAAGGIMNGEDIKRYLELGVAAAQLGTAFVQCPESAINESYRSALFTKPAITQITDSISGRPARALFGSWHQFVDLPHRPPHAGYPYTYDIGKALNGAATSQGQYGYGVFWAGSNVEKLRSLNASDLMQTLKDELS